MWLVFLFLILLIGFWLSRVEICLRNVDISEKNYDYKIDISFKLFGILKLFSLKLDRYGLKIFNKKIPISLKNVRKLDKRSLDLLKDLSLNLKKVKFVLKIGIIDVGLTNIAIVLFSTIFPLFIRKRVKPKNLKYEILPEYNKFCIKFNGKIIVSVRLLNLIKFHFKNKKTEITHTKNKIMV